MSSHQQHVSSSTPSSASSLVSPRIVDANLALFGHPLALPPSCARPMAQQMSGGVGASGGAGAAGSNKKARKEVFIVSAAGHKVTSNGGANRNGSSNRPLTQFDAKKLKSPPLQPPARVLPPSPPRPATTDPCVTILEQPASGRARFVRSAEDEKSSSFHLPGACGGPHPSIRLHNVPSDCEAVVIVSCLTHETPALYLAHPNRVLWTEGRAEQGVASATFKTPTVCHFKGLMVQSVPKEEAASSLDQRRRVRVDPFKKGFDSADPSSFDHSVVRLCFQVFLRSPTRPLVSLKPVVSDPVREARQQSVTTGGPFQIRKVNASRVSAVDGRKGVELTLERRAEAGEELEVRLEHRDRRTGARAWHRTVGGAVTPAGNVTADLPAYLDLKSDAQVKLYLFRKRDKRYSRSVQIQYVVGASATDSDDSTSSLPKVSSSFSINSMPENGANAPPTKKSPPLQQRKAGRRKSREESSSSGTNEDHAAQSALDRDMETVAATAEEEEGGGGHVVEVEEEDDNDAVEECAAATNTTTLGEALDAIGGGREAAVGDDLDVAVAAAVAEENKNLKEENAHLKAHTRALEKELARARSSAPDAASSDLLAEARGEAAEARRRADEQEKKAEEFRDALRDHSRGLDNLLWQLQQKETQVKALEERLRETYPRPSAEAGLASRDSLESPPSVSSSNGSYGGAMSEVEDEVDREAVYPEAEAEEEEESDDAMVVPKKRRRIRQLV